MVTSTATSARREIRNATLAGLALSALVEGMQLFSPVRRASIIDLATNAAGALAGALATAWLIAAVIRARGAKSYFGVPAVLLTGSYAVAVACEAITPLFRSDPETDVRGDPLTRLRVTLARSLPLERWQVPWLDIPLFAPAGFLAVLLLAELGWEARRTWLLVALAGAVFAVGLEGAHGVLGVSVRWEAALTHTVALALGAWAAQRWLASWSQRWRGGTRALVAVTAYGLLLALWAWRPLIPRLDPSAIAAQLTWSQIIPLSSLAVRADVFSALHVVQQFLLYVPLGALLTVWPLRRQGWWAGVRPALLLAIVLEVGHLAVRERLFDLTNALLAMSGVLLAWLVLRRSGYAPYGESLTTR